MTVKLLLVPVLPVYVIVKFWLDAALYKVNRLLPKVVTPLLKLRLSIAPAPSILSALYRGVCIPSGAVLALVDMVTFKEVFNAALFRYTS